MTFYQHTHQGGQVLKRVESTEYPRAITVVYTQEYPDYGWIRQYVKAQWSIFTYNRKSRLQST